MVVEPIKLEGLAKFLSKDLIEKLGLDGPNSLDHLQEAEEVGARFNQEEEEKYSEGQKSTK